VDREPPVRPFGLQKNKMEFLKKIFFIASAIVNTSNKKYSILGDSCNVIYWDEFFF
jgi:hypothetical protein